MPLLVLKGAAVEMLLAILMWTMMTPSVKESGLFYHLLRPEAASNDPKPPDARCVRDQAPKVRPLHIVMNGQAARSVTYCAMPHARKAAREYPEDLSSHHAVTSMIT